ncbi:NEDD8-conjugating protein Ubc12 [Malassezia pachydermatis]
MFANKQLWSQRKEADEARKQRPKISPAQLRAQKGTWEQRSTTHTDVDLAELDLPPTMQTRFPDPSNIMNFEVLIRPDEGMYRGGEFLFTIAINNNYPHDPPKVKGVAKVYHPNLDLDGNVCLNILREDWNPILNLNSVLVGLLFLFLDPNPDDPLNKEAAEELRRNKATFAADVQRAMQGGVVRGMQYDRVL